MRRASCILLALAALAIGAPVYASPITIPAGLNPGDTYFLVFVTSGKRNALSSSIADYDAFVNAQASLDADLLALGTTWKVIGSTAADSAATHLGLIASPIYNLAGHLVATGSADLFDGTIGSPVDFDQDGHLLDTLVYTGAQPDGSGVNVLGSVNVIHGLSDRTNFRWSSNGGYVTPQDDHNFYGISGELVVPAAAEVPEPGTIGLVVGPALLLFGRYRPRRRRPARRTPPTDPAAH